MSVNGVTCVFVVHFRVTKHIVSFLTGLTVNIHVSTITCVTGNNLVLHKALHGWIISKNGMGSASINLLEQPRTGSVENLCVNIHHSVAPMTLKLGDIDR